MIAFLFSRPKLLVHILFFHLLTDELWILGLRPDDDMDERDTMDRSRGSERGTSGASQAAHASNEKIRKTGGTTGKHYTSAKLHHRDVRR